MLILGRAEQSANADGISFFISDPFDLEMKDYQSQLDEITATKIAHSFIQSHNIKVYMLRDSNILIHSKLYYLYDSSNNNIVSHAIIGSSNFTASGLGIYKEDSNKELNLLCDSKETSKECKRYFDRLLDNCEDSTLAVLESLNTSYFYHTPKDVLRKISSYYISELEELSSFEQRSLESGVKAFNLYDFQKSAAHELLKRLKTYGIALLADPVGAGKTLTALAVSSVYKRIVIITPPKLKAQWESYIKDDDFRFNLNIRFYTYNEAQSAKDGDFLTRAELVVIDESHNFRNKNKSYENLRKNLGADSHLLLLSATPINNSYLDLGHQLSLKKNKIKISDELLEPSQVCEEANRAAKEAESNSRQVVLNQAYYKLCSLIYSRSAKEIVGYLKEQDKDLPKRVIEQYKLSSIPEHISFKLEDLLNLLGVGDSNIASLKLCIYDPFDIAYLREDIIDKLKNDRLKNLGEYSTPRGFLAMNLVKALESSLDAFLSMLGKIISYHKRFIEDTLEVESSDDLDDFSYPKRLQEVIDKGYKDELTPLFISDIKSDYKKLSKIETKLSSYDKKSDFCKSAKFKKLCEIIEAKILESSVVESSPNASKPPLSRKLIIFTESIITAEAIKDSLKARFSSLNIASITGNTSTNEFRNAKRLFSPRSLEYDIKNKREIDILVATDVLSEGQNLQDCGNLINWDIAFNPVRAIQRIGRICRIGSKHEINHITHFFPDMELEKYINLESKLRFKLNAANSAMQIDSPFTNIEANHKRERERQYKALEHEIVELEDAPSVSLHSFASQLSLIAQDLNIKNCRLKDGIFSIAKGELSLDLIEEDSRENLLLVALQTTSNLESSLDSKDSTTNIYLALYDLTKGELIKGVSEEDKTANLALLQSLAMNDINNSKLLSEFSKLEDFTNDYRDLSYLRAVFEDLTKQLDSTIKKHDRDLLSTKSSASGFSKKQSKRFKLISWLLINPNFNNITTKQ